MKSTLLGSQVPEKDLVAKFITALYKQYVALHFTYMEIDPVVVTAGKVYILILAAKPVEWVEVEKPPPFGRDAFPEEPYITDIDAKTGASLKLTILNESGRYLDDDCSWRQH